MNIPYYGATVSAERAVNHLLGLNASGNEQDWEIEFADPSKFDVMLEHLEKQALDTPTRSALCLLLVASFDEAFGGGRVTGIWEERASRALSSDPVILRQMRYFWIDLGRAVHEGEIRKLLSIG